MHKAPCRHRERTRSPEVHRCGSPKLLGLKLVTTDQCGRCFYRDHESTAAPPTLHLLPCLRRGTECTPSEGVYPCSHPRHRQTTEAQCRKCPDYLFPILSPLHTPKAILDILNESPGVQPDGWWTWPNVHEALRKGAADFIARTPAYPEDYRGRGIVIVGGGRYFPSVYVTVRVLRRVRCRLPIQVWHFSGEITPAMRELLAPYDVTFVDADEMARRHPFRFLHGHHWKGWQLKPYAIAHCPFREVLLLDADSYPTVNPETLFDWRLYRRRGAIFWPDLPASAYLLPPSKWKVFDLTPNGPPFESGQVLINKQKCWRELQLTLWYNARADLMYHIVWGDKDTFNVAWRRLGTRYAMTTEPPAWEMHTILQHGPDGKVLFQHRCQDKFRLAGEQFTSNHQPEPINRFNPRLVHEKFCFQLLDELRGLELTSR